METVETRVSKSSFSGIKGAKKERKMLEKSSTRYLGAGCRRFESCHSDQNSGKTAVFGGFSALKVQISCFELTPQISERNGSKGENGSTAARSICRRFLIWPTTWPTQAKSEATRWKFRGKKRLFWEENQFDHLCAYQATAGSSMPICRHMFRLKKWSN